MRFLDSSIFLHAVLDPGPKLTDQALALKERARIAMREIDGGEHVATTVVHLNEIANKISKSEGGLPKSHEHVGGLLANPHVRVLDVSRDAYERTLELARLRSVEIADALAYVFVKQVLGTREIYTTNAKHFLVLDRDIRVLPA